ncbi:MULTISPECIES: SPFH domain-containing protein [Collinsella]|uniref:SPFH domain-containing protein n=1 Tax=Collinsella tanakaei TaxID=626935 RepID=A0A3E4QVY6_9ACTN|nr:MULTISPECIES: SPFH domain-containing protein [Collinsella]RGL11257.1 SPFH domain-containing protein [Collinsella tanakaei]
MSVEKKIKAKSGYGMLAIVAVLLAVIVGLFIWSVAGMAGTPEGIDTPAVYGWGLGVSIFAFLLWFIPLSGFFSLQPGQARVCILFGKYVGTVRDEGFFWANPFYSRSMGGSAGIGEMLELEMSDSKAAKAAAQKAAKGNPTTISTRVRTLNGERLKVNDKMGNPIEIANVVVWHVADTAKALFDVDDYQSYVAMQAETALRHVASIYAYDHAEENSDSMDAITLRANVEEVSTALKHELSQRLAPAGVTVDDARLTHLAYSPEIAQAMLRRQQAEAVIAARKKIVEGAVSMVDMAVKEMAAGGTIELDEERKAQMASNLMVVLCGESEAHPVLNAGSLY